MVPAVLAALKLAPAAISLASKGIAAIKGAKGIGGALTKSAPALTAAVQNSQSVGSTANIGSLAGKAVDVVKSAADSGLLSKLGAKAPGLISTIADVAKGISTNDPEWFGEFKSAGATMNELIASDTTGNYGWAPDGMLSQTDRQVIQTNVSNVVQGISFPCGKTSEQAEANLLPTILADVRKSANNVLADDTHQYWESTRDFAYLYEVYYAGMKLLEYSEHLPINIPAANQIFPAIAPKNISQFRGMIESLGHYLKSTVRLPYALVAYIRWRFGTMFLSDDSENTAMVSYSPQVIEWRYKDITPITDADDLGNRTAGPITAWHLTGGKLTLVRGDVVVNGLIEDTYHTSVGYNLETSPIEAWISSIMRAQTRVASRGRAPADIRLAYDSMSIDYTVEHRHYDAKEANVRCNAAYFGPFEAGMNPREWPQAKPVAHNAVVVMNSALPMSEGIQSMCLSTVFEGRNCQDFSFFPIMGKVLFTPWSVMAESCIEPKVGQLINEQGEIVRQVINGQSSGFAGYQAYAAMNLEAGGFDPIMGFAVPLTDLDCREAIIYGAGGCEVYTYFKNTIDFLVMRQLYAFSSVEGVRLPQALLGTGSFCYAIDADGVQSNSLFATKIDYIGTGWHRFHVKSNYRDLTQAFYSPKFGYVNAYVQGGVCKELNWDDTTQNCYGYTLFHASDYALVYEANAQERVSVFDTNAVTAAHVTVPDTQFGNTYPVNSDSKFVERAQALMCCIGTHLINDYAKQLEIFHPGAGQMYSTFKSAEDLENGTIFLTGLQSYDYATITQEQIAAIHRTAHRNLTRMSLTQKTGAGATQEAKDMTAGIIDAAIGG